MDIFLYCKISVLSYLYTVFSQSPLIVGNRNRQSTRFHDNVDRHSRIILVVQSMVIFVFNSPLTYAAESPRSTRSYTRTHEHRHQKICLWGFRPGPTQTGLYIHRNRKRQRLHIVAGSSAVVNAVLFRVTKCVCVIECGFTNTAQTQR